MLCEMVSVIWSYGCQQEIFVDFVGIYVLSSVNPSDGNENETKIEQSVSFSHQKNQFEYTYTDNVLSHFHYFSVINTNELLN